MAQRQTKQIRRLNDVMGRRGVVSLAFQEDVLAIDLPNRTETGLEWLRLWCPKSDTVIRVGTWAASPAS